MQIVHATFHSGEGKKAVEYLSTLGVNIEDYKLISSETGDLLIINLLYGDTNMLLDNLTSRFDFEGDKSRSLVIFTPDTVIPRDKEKLKEESFHASRESLVTFAQNKSRADREYILLVILSAVITSLGLILDNVAVIVGGMVIAPVLGPILGVTIGIVLGNTELIKKGLWAEVLAITFAVLVGSVFGFLTPDVGITNSLRIRMFPTIADLFIALAAGAAGGYSLIKGHLESGLVGVMVAASLLPVMSTIGIGISLGNRTMIVGPSLLLLGNYLSLTLANIIVFYFKGLKPQIWYKNRAEKLVKKSLVIILAAVVILSIPLGLITIYQFYIEKPEAIIRGVINSRLAGNWSYRIESITVEGRLINIYLYAEDQLQPSTLEGIKDQIESRLAGEYNINFRLIPVQRISL